MLMYYKIIKQDGESYEINWGIEIKCEALPSILLLFQNQVFCVVLVLLSWVKVKNFQNPEL